MFIIMKITRGIVAFVLIATLASFAARADDDYAGMDDLKQLSLDELLEIEVTTVSRRPEKLSQTASAVQVITNEAIRRHGATNIPEALRLAGNLHVAQKGAHAWGISARGFNTELANKLLVLIDGRAVYTPLFSGVFWDRQDYLLEDIDRIEVISGPGGALWGANAVNGVINVISKAARDTQGWYAEAAGGSELNGLVAARYGGQAAPGIHYRIYGKYSDRDGAALAGGGDAGDPWRMQQWGFRLDAETGGSGMVTLQGDVYENTVSQTTAAPAETSGGNLLARWTRTLAGGSDFSLQVYYDRTHLHAPEPALVTGGIVLAPPGILVDELDTFDVDFQYNISPGPRHHIIWGLGYRFTHDVVQNSPPLGFFPATLDQHLFNAFVQDEIQLQDALTLTVGTKLEHNDYTGVEVEPSARMQWTLSPDHTLWAAVSRAIRAPSRIDRDSSLGSPPYFVLLTGSPDFKSETLIAYEAGWRGQFAQTATAAVSVFWNVYDDIRSTVLNPVTIFPLYFQNGLEADTYGAEITTTWQAAARWRLSATYTLLREDVRVQPGQTDFNNALNETADPRHQFSLRSLLNLGAGWELDAALRHVGSLPTNNAGVLATVPAYTELDLRLGWHVTDQWEVSLVGRNLLHDRHAEYRISNAPTEVERAWHGKIVWRF